MGDKNNILYTGRNLNSLYLISFFFLPTFTILNVVNVCSASKLSLVY